MSLTTSTFTVISPEHDNYITYIRLILLFQVISYLNMAMKMRMVLKMVLQMMKKWGLPMMTIPVGVVVEVAINLQQLVTIQDHGKRNMVPLLNQNRASHEELEQLLHMSNWYRWKISSRQRDTYPSVKD